MCSNSINKRSKLHMRGKGNPNFGVKTVHPVVSKIYPEEEETVNLGVQLRHEHAKLPMKGSRGSAGYDLYSVVEVVILPQSREVIPVGFSMQIPYGYYGRIAPRSSLAVTHGINVGAGVVDADYRGLVSVVLFNHDRKTPFKVSIGDRVAQIIITPCASATFYEVKCLNQTERGEGGFGSTGK